VHAKQVIATGWCRFRKRSWGNDERNELPVFARRGDAVMTMKDGGRPDVWPDALALACPDCDRAVPIEGMRPNGTLFFYCPAHSWPDNWFMTESWSSKIERVNPHLDAGYSWTTVLETRLEFMNSAMRLFLRAGGEDDCLILQGTMPDNFVRLHHLPGGDGRVLIEVSSRLSSPCTDCPKRPLDKPNHKILLELGFAPPGEWVNYSSGAVPHDPDQLTAVTETVFREAFEQPEDAGSWHGSNTPRWPRPSTISGRSCEPCEGFADYARS
jgi:hypothetical protein